MEQNQNGGEELDTSEFDDAQPKPKPQPKPKQDDAVIKKNQVKKPAKP